MSNVINDLIRAYQEEVDKLSRNGNPIWGTVYDELAGRRGNWDTEEAEQVFKSLEALYNFYYDERYRNKDENAVFDYVLEDALKFKWAKTLERNTSLPATNRELTDMDKILNELAELEAEMGTGRNRRTNTYSRSGTMRNGNVNRRPAKDYNYSTPKGGNNYTPRSSFGSGETADPREGERRRWAERNEREDNPRDRRFEEREGERRREQREEVAVDVDNKHPDFNLDDFVMHRNRWHPDVKKNEQGEWIITSMEAFSRFRLPPTRPHLEYVDPWTERMELVVGPDGYVIQRILELKNMDIEDHKWVIQPKQHRFAKTPPPEIFQPLVVVNENDIEIHKGSEVLKLAYQVIEEWVKEGKLPKGITKLAQVEDEELRSQVMAEANARLIKLIQETSNAKAAEKVKNVPAAGQKQSFFTLMEEEDNLRTGEVMELVQHNESVPVRTLKDAVNYVMVKQLEDGKNEGAVVLYERTDVLYRTQDKVEYDKIKEVSTPLKFRSKDLVSAYRLLCNEGVLPRDMALIIDRRATDVVNRALKDVLSLDVKIDGFLEDFQDLSKLLKDHVKEGRLTEEQFNMFYYFVEMRVCNVAFPTLESLKQHFNFDEEALASQSVKCVYEYDCGSFVYLPFNATDLGLGHSHATVLGYNKRNKVTTALSGVDTKYSVILGTKDGLFFRVLEDKTNEGYLLFPTTE